MIDINTTLSNRQKMETEAKLIFSNSHLHERSLYWLDIATSIKKSGGVKPVLWTQTAPLSEMMRSCKCFTHVSKMTHSGQRSKKSM